MQCHDVLPVGDAYDPSHLYTHRFRGLNIAVIGRGEVDGRNRKMVHLCSRSGEYLETFNSLAELKDIINQYPDNWGANHGGTGPYNVTRR